MKYGQQLQNALDRFDNSLRMLHTYIKRGENKKALEFMGEQGPLKDRFDELQNMVTVAGGPGSSSARGVSGTGTFRQ